MTASATCLQAITHAGSLKPRCVRVIVGNGFQFDIWPFERILLRQDTAPGNLSTIEAHQPRAWRPISAIATY
eukprot:6485586-Amphidinium_carterae.2